MSVRILALLVALLGLTGAASVGSEVVRTYTVSSSRAVASDIAGAPVPSPKATTLTSDQESVINSR